MLHGSEMNGNLKILLADDDKDLLRSLTTGIGRVFRKRVDLKASSDSVAARQWIESNSPDIVVTDLEMPLVDGFEILKFAKARNPFCQVIVYSGYFSAESLRLALKLEATDYLSKSGETNELVDALDHAYRRIVRWTREMATEAVSV